MRRAAMQVRQAVLIIAVIAAGILLHTLGSQTLNEKRVARSGDMGLVVAMPVPVQLLMAGGDRYLAANVNVFRALMVDSANPDKAIVATQAKVQSAAAVFNPAHEDNYYLAAATLSWQGEVSSAQQILQSATMVRPHDMYPPFFYGFNQRWFLHDVIGGAKSIEQAAERTEGGNRQALQAMAARWYAKLDDSQEARNIVNAMVARTRDPALRMFLQRQAGRIEGLIVLKKAVAMFREKFSRAPTSLDELQKKNILDQLPVDPTGQGYGLDASGQPVFLAVQPPMKQGK